MPESQLLYHNLDQYDPKAHRLSTKKELEEDEKWFRQELQVPEADPKADDKPGNDKPEKKNSRTDWLRNKQIIVNNRAEIDDYLSNTFEQILYQVEERGGKSNA
ncbi:hypothetical protein C1646_666143 [Rhizophagus diaphanus]|nr:hypothetical protein C1646_666143 [Rhizophagus diaphanus] [Rhizophagus sp. MUCL 43196]